MIAWMLISAAYCLVGFAVAILILKSDEGVDDNAFIAITFFMWPLFAFIVSVVVVRDLIVRIIRKAAQ